MIKLSLAKKFGIELVDGDVFEGICIRQKFVNILNKHDDYKEACIESFTPRLISGGIPDSIDGDALLEITNGNGLVLYISARNVAWHAWTTWRPSMEWLVQQAADKPVTYKDDTQHFGEDVQVSADPKVELIHKAWVDLNGKIENGCEDMLTIWHVAGENFANGDYYFSSSDTTCRKLGAKFICTVKEFNDYCEKMKASPSDDFISRCLLITPSDKPTFTQAMADAGELPPVGSMVKVCLADAGFHVDGYDECFESKICLVAASFINKYGSKMVVISNDLGKHGCYVVKSIKPIDTRTEKEKAIAKMVIDIGMDDDVLTHPSTVIAKMFDTGYLK